MQHAIWDQIDEKETITSLQIENVINTTSATMNEMLNLIMQEQIPQTGLKELNLSTGAKDHRMNEPLNESIMQSLLNKCEALSSLKVTRM